MRQKVHTRIGSVILYHISVLFSWMSMTSGDWDPRARLVDNTLGATVKSEGSETFLLACVQLTLPGDQWRLGQRFCAKSTRANSCTSLSTKLLLRSLMVCREALGMAQRQPCVTCTVPKPRSPRWNEKCIPTAPKCLAASVANNRHLESSTFKTAPEEQCWHGRFSVPFQL